jgi:ectoine hydroxylase-related dioxygenase (phytanoyl-CoA dioxygenase family)
MLESTLSFAEQVEAHGFAVVGGVFGSGEVDAILDAIVHASLARSRAGARHAMRIPVVAELSHDARLITLVRDVLGPRTVPYRATLFDKSPVSNWLVVWHQDTALPLRRREERTGWGPWSEKAGVIYAHAPTAALTQVLALRIHLDDSTALNGPLRVLPGTHRHGVLTDATVSALAQRSEPVDCVVARGGVLAMRPLVIHASSKSRSEAPRRVLHIEYAADIEIEQGLELAVA